MTADIELHDKHVDVLGGRLVLRADDGSAVVNARTDDRRGGRHAVLELGNNAGEHQPLRAALSLHSQEGNCTLTGTRLSVESVNGRRVSATEAHVTELSLGGGEPNELGSNGIVRVRNDRGEITLTIDAADGDIVLATIGSLVAKINDLQAQLDALSASLPGQGQGSGKGQGQGGGQGQRQGRGNG